MNKRDLLTAVFFGTIILSAPPSLQARSKLNALPGREKVTVNLANPAATLVEEERVLTLQEGLNQVDFSWKGVNIDPDSLRLTILGRNFPHQYWELNRDEADLRYEVVDLDTARFILDMPPNTTREFFYDLRLYEGVRRDRR